MTNPWTDRWNERYSNAEYAYGTEPNDYLKKQLEKLKPGTILFPAEGEGRNAVFAAKLGWTVSTFDISSEGRKKAHRLAEANHVAINYRVGELEEGMYGKGQFDAIALIYAHFPADIRPAYHTLLNTFLRKEGILIFEAFSKRHLDYIAKNDQVGGPREASMLFSIEEVKAEFPDYSFFELEEREIELNEGPFHHGTGSVIRFVGRKK